MPFEISDNEDELLESFESAWDAGETPDVFRFAERCPRESFGATVAELIQIDLERRWKSANAELKRELSKYLEVLPPGFTNDELLELVCWEYRIRNQWGDCISRKQVWQSHAYLGSSLIDRIDSLSKTMDWPSVAILINGQTILEVELDRDIEAGRQKSMEQMPWSLSSSPFVHRIILSEAGDPTLSRNQLAISRSSPGSVLVQNKSSNRAIALRGQGAIDSGESLVCQLPVFVHLGANRYLRICNSAD